MARGTPCFSASPITNSSTCRHTVGHETHRPPRRRDLMASKRGRKVPRRRCILGMQWDWVDMFIGETYCMNMPNLIQPSAQQSLPPKATPGGFDRTTGGLAHPGSRISDVFQTMPMLGRRSHADPSHSGVWARCGSRSMQHLCACYEWLRRDFGVRTTFLEPVVLPRRCCMQRAAYIYSALSHDSLRPVAVGGCPHLVFAVWLFILRRPLGLLGLWFTVVAHRVFGHWVSPCEVAQSRDRNGVSESAERVRLPWADWWPRLMSDVVVYPPPSLASSIVPMWQANGPRLIGANRRIQGLGVRISVQQLASGSCSQVRAVLHDAVAGGGERGTLMAVDDTGTGGRQGRRGAACGACPGRERPPHCSVLAAGVRPRTTPILAELPSGTRANEGRSHPPGNLGQM